ncbi:MAG: alpha-hydroxy-acid oxidizing protein [Acidobacteria bacterium]|nr:MAG: alpha-hydroxy-acid oxidizing protein [Acidobacteriota bacterium]REK07829.1 MAG: alpha-hydroxy-acid oxidizing protein [Acidobacteriota bacterium]
MLRTLRSVWRFRRFELDADLRRLQGVADVEDLRELARRRLPSGVFDYIDGAAEDEITAARNEEGFVALELRPRILRDVSAVEVGAEILGRPAAMPLVLAPTGFSRMAHSQGELAVARAAQRAGVPYTLSTLSTRSIEEAAAAAPEARLWFQVYVWRDRGLVEEMLQRARESGYEAIVITVDTAVLGRRERDVRSGFSLPPRLGLGTLVEGALHPGWTLDFLRGGPIEFANVAGRGTGPGGGAVALAEYVNAQFDAALSWRDLDWFRERWDGPIVLKGVQTVDDAVLAAEAGVDAVALSNHGGRQLDGAPPPVELIEPVREAIEDRLEIYCDGGVRRGSDVVKALALGADAVMVGRAYLYALAAAGESGVDWVLDFLRSGTARTLALCGLRGVDEIEPSLVRWRTPRG